MLKSRKTKRRGSSSGFWATPSKLLKDSKSSVRDCVESCSWYLEATWTQICRFCRMLADSMARRHSRESSTDREPKKFTSHWGETEAEGHDERSL